MILHDDVGLVGLDARDYLTQRYRAADTGHVLEGDLIRAFVDEELGEVDVVLYGMNWRIGDAERGLGDHSRFLCVMDGRDDVARVVKAAEDTGDVRSLGFLDLIEQLAQVLGARGHTKAVERTVEHVGLDTGLMEGLGPLTHSVVRVLSVEEVYLLEAAAVGFDAVEASHFDDRRSDLHQLVYAWLVLTRTLPHIPEDQAEFYFSFHRL